MIFDLKRRTSNDTVVARSFNLVIVTSQVSISDIRGIDAAPMLTVYLVRDERVLDSLSLGRTWKMILQI